MATPPSARDDALNVAQAELRAGLVAAGVKLRDPYVGEGADGCRRSAQVDREEADTLAAGDPRRAELAASAERWEVQAAVEDAAPTASPAPAPASSSTLGGIALGDRPRLMGGLIVPAANVLADRLASAQVVPLRTVASFGITRRAIVAYGRGRPIPLWIGDDEAERDAAFAELMGIVGAALR